MIWYHGATNRNLSQSKFHGAIKCHLKQQDDLNKIKNEEDSHRHATHGPFSQYLRLCRNCQPCGRNDETPLARKYPLQLLRNSRVKAFKAPRHDLVHKKLNKLDNQSRIPLIRTWNEVISTGAKILTPIINNYTGNPTVEEPTNLHFQSQ